MSAATPAPASPHQAHGTSEHGSWTVVNGDAEFGPFPTRTAAVEFMDAGGPSLLWNPYAVNETDLPRWFNNGRPGSHSYR
jgi:hypothetical protein